MQPTAPAPFPLNARGTTRWNSAFAYLDAARARPNLTILAETLADRVVVERGAAVGVACEGGVLDAERVVVSAGAYASPAILLRSGIGPREGAPGGTPSSRPPTSFRSARGSSTIPASASPGRPLRSSST